MTERVPVAIVGAGIAGLTLSLALARRGIRSRIVERAAVLAEVGAGLQLSPNASRLLIDLGLGPALDAAAVRPEALAVRDARGGGEIVRLPLGAAVEAAYGAPYLVIHRADLQAALLAAVRGSDAITLDLGATLDEVVTVDGTVGVRSRAGDQEPVRWSVEALVGADGVRSWTRGNVLGAGPAVYTGRTAWRATLPIETVPDRGDLSSVSGLWLGAKAHLVHYPVKGGREINLVAAVDDAWRDEGWDVPGDPDVLQRAFRTWPDPVRRLLAAPASWRKWALCGAPPDAPWTRGRIALIGDAQHAMLPFVAQGGAMAIEDAAVLARHIADGQGPMEARLAAFAAARGARVRAVVATARRNATVYHLSGLPAVARNAALRAMGPKGLARSMDWIWGWRDAP